ncbi:MAG: hypothetical protein L6R42_005868 [Xanthoria sp. 1 TBL-2021]|nr:MAG: hypothetical protein L6R42_005868 [Xanthoria sp. 1 TBL-2021]
MELYDNRYNNAPDAPSDAPSDAFHVGELEELEEGPGASHVLGIAQYKPYADMGLTYEQCRHKHQKNKEVWDEAKDIEGKEDYRLVTIVITNCHVSGVPEDSDEDVDLLVVDSTKFTKLYGVFDAPPHNRPASTFGRGRQPSRVRIETQQLTQGGLKKMICFGKDFFLPPLRTIEQMCPEKPAVGG